MKNYFLILFSVYAVILITKFIFTAYLHTQFIDFTNQELIYAILWGYKFDFAASAIIALIVSLFDFNKKLFAFIGSLLITTVALTQIGDILYFDESSRHIGYEIFDIIVDAQSLFMTALSQHTLIFFSTIIVAFFLLIYSYKLYSTSTATRFNKYYLVQKIFIILISIFFVRGMVQHIPLHPWQANEIGNSQLASVSLNSIYNIAYTIVNQSKKLKPVDLPKLDKAEQLKAMSEIYNSNQKNLQTPIINTKPNIVFFFLESWSGRNMKPYGYPNKTTPNFDKLLEQSIRPRAMVASGHRTTEGIFATLTSFQNPLGKTIAKTQLQDYQYDSIIYLLNKEGYQSAFFQGTSKDTSGTGSLLSYLGFSESYGKRDIQERIYEENYWGVHDTDLYNFINKKLDSKQIKEPFVIGLNNASTHDIKMPQGEPSFQFSEDENLNKKLNTLHYSDRELGKFIANIEEKFPNTIFVIFADHCGSTLQDNLDNYIIPFAIYSKKLIEPKYYDILASQRDIAPTVYDLVLGKNESDTQNFSGTSLLKKEKSYADYFHNGILGWIEDNIVVEINTANNEINCYNLNWLQKESIACNKINSDEMMKRALSYTTISQKLLFEGKMQEFHSYKKLETNP